MVDSMIPAESWMDAHAPAWLARQYPLIHFHFTEILAAFAGGWLVGRAGHHLWLRFAVLFAGGQLFLLRLALIWAQGFAVIPVILWCYAFMAIVPFAVIGAWLGSRPDRRRLELRRAAGLCMKCGYDLTGNTTGVCPECGTQK
jgi:hypothetical protein